MTLTRYIDDLLRNGGDLLARALQAWRGGVGSEVSFWTQWFATKGLQWPDEYARRMQPRPLVPWVAALLPPSGPATVLDVGAGPITATGHFLANRAIDFTAVDPLAHHYAAIIAKAGITVPVRTGFAFAEDLSARFDAGSIDVVTCINALDHTIDPVLGIIEMLIVARTGGRIFLSHARNEAVTQNYEGFHHWNFDTENQDVILWSKERRINLTSLFADIAEIGCDARSTWINVVIAKHRDLPIDLLTYHRAMRAAVLEATLRTIDPG